MKKSVILLALVLVIATVATLTVNAGWQGTTTLPTINLNVEAGTYPTIDGQINDNEGWSASSPFDESSVGHFWAQSPLASTGNFRFAANNDGLFFAMAIAEAGEAWKTGENGENVGEEPWKGNTFVFSTGPDESGDDYGFNGDVIVLGIDPGRVLYDAGYTENSSYSPWYCLGIFEGNIVKVYRQKVDPGEITDKVKAAGVGGSSVNGPAGGWNVEVFIPWSLIIDDVNKLAELNNDEIELTKDQIISAVGIETKATVMYQDRYFNAEQGGALQTWGRYITVPEFLPSGIKGSGGSGDDIKSYGVTLNITGTATADTTNTTPGSTDGTTNGTTDGTTSTTATNGTTSTTPAASTNTSSGSKTSTNTSSGTKTSTTTSGSTANKAGTNTQANTTTDTETVEAATTLDTGIVVSAAVLALSAGAFIFLGKKRKNDLED